MMVKLKTIKNGWKDCRYVRAGSMHTFEQIVIGGVNEQMNEQNIKFPFIATS